MLLQQIVQAKEAVVRWGSPLASRCGHVVAVGPMFDAGPRLKNEASRHAYSFACTLRRQPHAAGPHSGRHSA